MKLMRQFPWQDPLSTAALLQSEPELALLYSSVSDKYSGRYSFLAWECAEILSATTWSQLDAALTHNHHWYENAWFGWLGYGLRCDSEKLLRKPDSFITFPDAQLMRFCHIIRFDHHTQCLEYYAQDTPDYRWQLPPETAQTNIAATDDNMQTHDIKSDMTKQRYLDIVAMTKKRIEAGDFYQANITRKFTGRLVNKYTNFSVFTNLCRISPSTYSAYFKLHEKNIISSSPECFLHVDAKGNMLSRPIKGSAARGKTANEDEAIQKNLMGSEKDHAENRMIVDLVRNDMARVSVAGSVHVESSAVLSSFSTVHHLISSIVAKKSPDTSTIKAVEACFPPGSMTGAPKIAAIKWCSENEPFERGVYSGALGWFGGDGNCDLSVVIRTLLIDDDQFEFQVGGGIVADSNPELEWRETLTKARAIAMALGISEETLAEL